MAFRKWPIGFMTREKKRGREGTMGRIHRSGVRRPPWLCAETAPGKKEKGGKETGAFTPLIQLEPVRRLPKVSGPSKEGGKEKKGGRAGPPWRPDLL